MIPEEDPDVFENLHQPRERFEELREESSNAESWNSHRQTHSRKNLVRFNYARTSKVGTLKSGAHRNSRKETSYYIVAGPSAVHVGIIPGSTVELVEARDTKETLAGRFMDVLKGKGRTIQQGRTRAKKMV